MLSIKNLFTLINLLLGLWRSLREGLRTKKITEATEAANLTHNTSDLDNIINGSISNDRVSDDRKKN